MGKSIVHCSVCGKRVREEDFAERKALTVDFRTFCSDCIPAELAKAPSPRPGSTSRIPMSGQTPRRPFPAAPRKSVLPLALGIGGAVVVIALLAVVLTRRTPAPQEPEPRKIVQAPARPAPAPIPEPKQETPPAPSPATPVAAPAPAPASPKAEKETPPAEPATLNPTITSPAPNATFDAPASIPIHVEAPGDVEKVEVYYGALKIGEVSRRPFDLAWKEVDAGNYTLTAVATGRGGETAISPPVAIRVIAVVAAPAEDKKPAPAPAAPPADGGFQRRVDEAIAKGVVFLKAAGVKDSMDPALPGGLFECPELILWTMVHARVPENDPNFVKLFNYVMSKKLERTYAVSLQAMILEELNRVKYQTRIAACAQFLVDAQCGNGQWSYTGPARPGVASGGLKLEVATGGGGGLRAKPPVVRKITTLRKMYEGAPVGDNSNSQYAALGMRACADAGIVIPKGVVYAAQTWWRISLLDDPKNRGVATESGSFAPAGWCYGPKDHGHAAYSSMTAGAVGAVAIWNFLEDEKSTRKDPTLHKGIAWLAANFSIKGNEGPSEHVKDTGWMLYYYLYALERAGVLAGTETFGGRKWYVEGAEAILRAQKADGSWIAPLPHGDRSETTNAVWDSCFAILFLKRATAPLVASTDARK